MNLAHRPFTGTRTQKAPEAPQCALFLDVGQARRHLRAYSQQNAERNGIFNRLQASRPSPGPHKLRESLPLTIFLRNRLKYALTGREVTAIVKQRLIKIDGKVRTDPTYPAGFMGALSGCQGVKRS